MIAVLTFPLIAAALVYWAGRKDQARDPRLTLVMLFLLAAMPMMSSWLPKFAVLPHATSMVPQQASSWPMILLGVWVAGFVVMMSRLVITSITLQRWKKQSTSVGHVDGIDIRMLETIASPVACGIISKVIFVPKSWSNHHPTARAMILSHELIHHRRHDPLRKLIAEITCTIHWFNPLVHWMANRLSLQCEFACDAEVLRQGASHREYATLLVNVACEQKAPALAIAMAKTSTLETRIKRIVQPTRKSSALAWVACSLLGIGSAMALSMTFPALSQEGIVKKDIQWRLSADPFPGNR